MRKKIPSSYQYCYYHYNILIQKAAGITNKTKLLCSRLTWISRAWYIIIRPSNITVERLIRHFSANEYEDSYSERKKENVLEISYK